MEFRYLIWLLVCGLTTLWTEGRFGPEGCEFGWHHFKDFCYLAVDAHIHFDSAKAICAIKGGSLTSLWGQNEVTFVLSLLQNIHVDKSNTWIGTGVIRNKWMWLDGSGNLEALFKDTSLPDVSKEMCGYLTSHGALEFMDCDLTTPVFVCKKPLDMIYVPSSLNITDEGILFPTTDRDEIVFERLWPPYLDQVILNMTSSNYIATVEVAQTTDCAYRCYTVDECRAFAVKCKSARKCSIRYCILLSGLDVR